jgi:hypothetical protein
MRTCLIFVTGGLLLAGLALTGCTQANSNTQSSSAGPSSKGSSPLERVALVDPLSEIRDPKNDNFVATNVNVVLDKHGVGPHTYAINVTSGTPSLRAYLSCTPGANFTVSIGKSYWSGCSKTFSWFADIPVTGTSNKVVVSVPAKTRFDLVVIPTPTS